MPTVKIPLGPVGDAATEIVLSEEAAACIDGYIGSRGEIVRRPGLEFLFNYNSNKPIIGVYWWPHANKVVAIDPTQVYFGELNTSGSSEITFSPIGSYAVVPASEPRASFATDGTYCFFTSGTNIYRISIGGSGPNVLIGPPSNPTHVAWLDGYLLCNNKDSNTFYWSNVNDYTTWAGGNLASAAGDADYIDALHVINRQIFLFGKVSIEIWEDNGVTPFERIPGGMINTGCCAPYSIIEADGDFIFLDDRRRFVVLSGRSITPIPCVYSSMIEGFADVSDCTGDRLTLRGRELLIFSFPKGGHTFVYNTQNKTWTEFSHWIEGDEIRKAWIVSTLTYAVGWGRHVAGSRFESEGYSIKEDTYLDFTDTMRFCYRTGVIDHGSTRDKRSEEVRIRVLRGQANVTDPKMMVRWRDNGDTAWSYEELIDLGNAGDTIIPVTLQRNGIYQTRQWEFSVTDNVPVTLLDAEEDVTFLR